MAWVSYVCVVFLVSTVSCLFGFISNLCGDNLKFSFVVNDPSEPFLSIRSTRYDAKTMEKNFLSMGWMEGNCTALMWGGWRGNSEGVAQSWQGHCLRYACVKRFWQEEGWTPNPARIWTETSGSLLTKGNLGRKNLDLHRVKDKLKATKET